MNKKSTLAGKISRDIFGVDKNLHRVIEVDLAELSPNPDQPRKTFDETALDELAASIDEYGLISPITVKKNPEGGYIIVAGERRFRAHQRLGRETIAAIVTEGDPAEIALIENVQREDLHPLDLAEKLAELINERGYTQDAVAKVIGKARNTVTQLLSLTRLPEQIRRECPTSDIPKSVLIEIAQVKGEPEQLRLWDQVKSGGVTVKAARKSKAGDDVKKTPSPQEKMLSAGRSFLRGLRGVETTDIIANQDQYHELLELRRQIDEEVDALQRHLTDT
jgi:ParB family chromosome partitioning protein